jgi:eukaryotic-like serine/threonine-protein kinase
MSSVTPRTPGGGSPFAERYELKNQAGVGGMGTVYQAIDRQTGTMVALKILHSRTTIEQARFDQEARVLAELSHPGIVRYFDHGMTPNGSPYIAMEWLEGETLEDRLGRGNLGPAAAAHVARLVLDALSAAHGRNIVHRDIKPGNIFLVGWKLTEIRLLDFGIARRVFDDKRLTRKGSTVGTPLYTSPEQARGRADVDGRADIFSLGCVLFEALTGEPPFCGETPLEVMTKVCAGRVPDISTKRVGLDGRLCRLVHAMLAPDASMRPQSAAGLSEDFALLVRALGGIGGETAATSPPATQARRDAISEIEEHLACAMLVSLGKRDPSSDSRPLVERRLGPKHAAETPASPRTVKDDEDVRLLDIRRLLESCACEMDRLINRTLLMTAPTVSTAHEQAIQLASAALALREREPDAKIALATGRATFLGRLPVGRLMDRLPMLMEGQEPGTIRLDDTTRRLLPARFLSSEMVGKVLLLHENRGPEGDSRGDASQNRFLGRDRDLASLEAVCAETIYDKVARPVLVLGPPGVGKTTLVRELLKKLPSPAPRIVRGAGTLPRVERRYPTLAPVLSTAGIDVQGKSSVHVETALADWLSSQCEQNGVVVLLEDLQWADSPSLEVVDHVLQSLHDKPIMVLGVGRDDVDDRFPGLWNARSVQRLRLRPLAQKHGLALLRMLAPMGPRSVEEFILDRWEGNPLFLEELVASTRHATMGVSDAVYAIVEGRMEGLEPDVRRVLRAASLYGEKNFSVESLLVLLGESARKSIAEWMEVLIMRNLIDRDVRLGEASYHFRERLIRDAAYRMLTSADRLLARRLARAFLEGEGRTLPETLSAPSSQTDVRTVTAG